MRMGQINAVPVAHGEGRFAAASPDLDLLVKNRQIATVYVGFDGKPVMDEPFNPNGSLMAIEGITSPDGRIFGRMGHMERLGEDMPINIYGDRRNRVFEAGVKYFS
jgi:phosphoribosylformylglycinamidine synthase